MKHRSRWGLDPRVVIALAAAVVLLLAVGLASIREQRRTMEAGDSVRHTIRVLEQITLVLQRASDAESGQRGYVLTGDPTYLKPYHDAVAALPQDFADLRKLTSDNPSQQARCDTTTRISSSLAEIRGARVSKRACCEGLSEVSLRRSAKSWGSAATASW